jgi:hypothetical protein
MIMNEGELRKDEYGTWNVAVPLPLQTRKWLLFIRYECWHKNKATDGRCGEQFKRPRDFEQHYIDNHIIPKESYAKYSNK